MNRFSDKKVNKLMLMIICLVMLSGCNGKNNVKVYNDKADTISEDDAFSENDSKKASGQQENESESEPAKNKEVYVQLCGAVKAPGVYKISSASRVFEAIELAGGATEEADVDSVNLARPVADEMKIYVPTKEEVENSNGDYFWEYNDKTFENEASDSEDFYNNSDGGDSYGKDDGLININEATKEKLMELPGIGEAKAEAIINYREENGSFNDISDIMNISGIKEAAFDKIKDLIKI